MEAGAELDRPDRSMSGRLLARGGCYHAFPASSLRIEVRRMLSLTRWLIVALALFATGGVSFAQPLEVEAARSSLPDKPRFTLSDHKDVVWCVAFSPDGKALVTCSGNRDAKAGEIRGYDLSSGKPVQSFLGEESHGIRWLSFPRTARPSPQPNMMGRSVPRCLDRQGAEPSSKPTPAAFSASNSPLTARPWSPAARTTQPRFGTSPREKPQ